MNRPAPSLQRRLFIALVILMGGVWVVMLASLSFATRHEVDELLDAHLAQTGTLLASHYSALAGETRLPLGERSSEYQSHVVFQVWHEGKQVAASLHAPATPLAPPGTRGYTDQQLGADTWRVFSITPTEPGVTVMVAETHTIRNDIIDASMIGAILPALLGLPVMLLGVWATVRGAMRPLKKLSSTLDQRPAQAVEPLDTDGMPREIEPLLDALNGLFARMGAMLAAEQRFTADAAHELRTPLAAIRMHVQVAMGAAGPDRQHTLAMALAGCDRAAHLVDQLLQLARLDASVNATHTPAACASIAEGVATLQPIIEREAHARGQTVEIQLAPEVPPVSLPPALAEALLRNLLDNAVRYSPEGGTVRLAISVQEDAVEIRVADSGPGMREEAMARLGERFFRELGTTQPGSGLGWSIIRAIAHRHHIDIHTFRSPALGGLEVVLRVPLPSRSGRTT